MVNFKEYLTVKQAAECLGVAVMTLHRWDAKGKLKALRHPINHYRLYKKTDLEKLLKKLNISGQRPNRRFNNDENNYIA